MASGTLALMQLADSAFPSGGFAFSSGLESLAKLGWLRALRDFEEYLECYLEQVASGDIPFLNSAHRAWDAGSAARPGGAEPRAELAETVREWDAWIVHPTQRRASLSQGQAWARAMEEAYGGAARPVRLWHEEARLPAHFLPVLGATLRAVGLPLSEAQALLLHMALRDQLGAAVRLGLLGSLQAQRLHLAFVGKAEAYLAGTRDWTRDQAVRMAPMIDLGQAGHPHLYSKLFQS